MMYQHYQAKPTRSASVSVPVAIYFFKLRKNLIPYIHFNLVNVARCFNAAAAAWYWFVAGVRGWTWTTIIFARFQQELFI